MYVYVIAFLAAVVQIVSYWVLLRFRAKRAPDSVPPKASGLRTVLPFLYFIIVDVLWALVVSTVVAYRWQVPVALLLAVLTSWRALFALVALRVEKRERDKRNLQRQRDIYRYVNSSLMPEPDDE